MLRPPGLEVTDGLGRGNQHDVGILKSRLSPARTGHPCAVTTDWTVPWLALRSLSPTKEHLPVFLLLCWCHDEADLPFSRESHSLGSEEGCWPFPSPCWHCGGWSA